MRSLTELQEYTDKLDRDGILACLADIALDWPYQPNRPDMVTRRDEALTLRLKMTTTEGWTENARAWLHDAVGKWPELASNWLGEG
jgi:hypothetical protein